MLPNTRHPHDEKWLEERFNQIVSITGINHAKAVAAKYSTVYNEVYNSVEEPHKRDGKARHEANQRLIKLIKSLGAASVQPNA